MNRVLHLQALKVEATELVDDGEPSSSAPALRQDSTEQLQGDPPAASGFLTKAVELRDKQSGFDPHSEEVLVSLIEAVPSVADGFSGLYQTFHLIRDLLGFSKLMLLTPGEEDPDILEALYSYGFDKTTRSRLAVPRASLPRNFRYLHLSQQLFQMLSEHDRNSAEHPFYIIGFGRPGLLGILIGTSPYTSLQEQGSPIFGPVSQLLDLHFPRFVGLSRVQETEVRLIPYEDLVSNAGQDDLFIELDLPHFLAAITDIYADLLGHRASELLALQALRFLPTGTLASWKDSETFAVFVPVAFPKVQEVIAAQLATHLQSWFSIDQAESFVRTRAALAT